MNFRVLPTQLQGVAEAVVRFFEEERGLTKFKIEEPVEDYAQYRPTLQTHTSEGHDVWIEVSELPYLQSLDTVVLHCVQNCLPVKLYVGFPEGTAPSEYKKNVDEARRKGVGAIEVRDGVCHVIHEALALSLAGLRTEDHTQFPARFRSTLSTAESTFRNGDPAKGASIIYDEIEALSRKLTQACVRKGWLRAGAAWPPRLDPSRDPWAKVMEKLIETVDLGRLPRAVSRTILSRISAVTEHRNESGHKPRNKQARVRRDGEMRTRFESAVDLLRDLATAVRPLRL